MDYHDKQVPISPRLLTTHNQFSLPQVTHNSGTTSRDNSELSGDTQIRTLISALHIYFEQSELRILCDVTARISRTDFVQVVLAHFGNVRPLFCATYVSPFVTTCSTSCP